MHVTASLAKIPRRPFDTVLAVISPIVSRLKFQGRAKDIRLCSPCRLRLQLKTDIFLFPPVNSAVKYLGASSNLTAGGSR